MVLTAIVHFIILGAARFSFHNNHLNQHSSIKEMEKLVILAPKMKIKLAHFLFSVGVFQRGFSSTVASFDFSSNPQIPIAFFHR